MNGENLVSDAELDFDSDLVCTLEGIPFTGTAFEEAPGLGRSEIPYRDGLQDGTARDWYPSGAPKGESHFVQGVLHGVAREFDQSGALTEETLYEHGIRVVRRTYAPDGSLVASEELAEDSTEADLLRHLRRGRG